ncbi:hypothetical protein ABTX85_34650 [Streptomyces sp. NPDC096097]|uniref:hypothetical protein n=1 Tax=Streptomyces sp. NPDC096097 TaxID=3155546 RepID=UPI00332371CF
MISGSRRSHLAGRTAASTVAPGRRLRPHRRRTLQHGRREGRRAVLPAGARSLLIGRFHAFCAWNLEAAGPGRHRAWLLAHDKIEVPRAVPKVSLVVHGGAGRRTSPFRLDAPLLVLADEAHRARTSCPGWSTDADAGEPAALAAGSFGASVGRLTAPGTARWRCRAKYG